MKRVFLLLVMIVVGSIFGNVETILAEDAEQYEYGDFIYEIQDGTVKIVDVNEEQDVVSVTIPAVIDNMPVTAIDERIFSGLSEVTEVIIPESVSRIEAGAFSWCGYLDKITVDSNNEYYTDIEGVLFEKKNKMLHTYPAGKSTQKYSIPEGTIGIGEEAFFDCDELTEIWIPESVNMIGISAVSLCDNLQSIVVASDNEVYSDINGILFEKKRKVLLKYPTDKSDLEYSIPEGTIEIGEAAFSGCRYLAKIIIPDSVTIIGEYAFSNCEELTEVIMPDTLSAINKSTFYGCRGLTEIRIPKGTTEIGQTAFSACYSLTEIWIPESVSVIGTGAFNVCPSLCAIRVAPDNDNYADIDGVLFEKTTKMLQKYPVGKNNSEYSIPEGTIEIGEDAFWGSNLYKIIIPDSVTTIGDSAFSNCEELTEITVPNSVTAIGESAFWGCGNLYNITIPDNVTTIGNRAFVNCKELKEIIIPKGVSVIKLSTFSNCFNLTEVIIPDSVTIIEENAFGGCENLYELIIPDSVKSIEGDVFEDCDNLTLVVNEDSYAYEYAKTSGIPYRYSDGNDWLLN